MARLLLMSLACLALASCAAAHFQTWDQAREELANVPAGQSRVLIYYPPETWNDAVQVRAGLDDIQFVLYLDTFTWLDVAPGEHAVYMADVTDEPACHLRLSIPENVLVAVKLDTRKDHAAARTTGEVLGAAAGVIAAASATLVTWWLTPLSFSLPGIGAAVGNAAGNALHKCAGTATPVAVDLADAREEISDMRRLVEIERWP